MKIDFRTIKRKCTPRVWRPRARAWLALIRPIPYALSEPRLQRPRARAWLEYWTPILRNLAIIIGVVIAIIGAYFTYKHIQTIDSIAKRRTAIDAVYLTRKSEFVCAYARVKTVARDVSDPDQEGAAVMKKMYCQGNKEKNLNNLINDLNLVFSTFKHLCQLYREGIADREIILNGVTDDVIVFSGIRYNLLLWFNSTMTNPPSLTNLHFEYLHRAVVDRDIEERKKYQR